MLKHAFRNYITTLHQKNRKDEVKKFLRSFISVWIFLWIFSDIVFLELMTRILPLCLIKWTNLVSGSYMGKKMLLCPMNQESRKEYINYMLGFKIGCPVLLGMFIEMLWSMAGRMDFKRSLLLIIIYVSAGIAENIHIDCIDKMNNQILQGRKDRKGNVKWAGINFSVSCVAMFLFLEYGMTELEGIQGNFYRILALAGSVYLIMMDIVILCRQYKDMLEEVTDYELAFHIPGRLHYIDIE